MTAKIKSIKLESALKLNTLKEELENAYPQDIMLHKNMCVYACGSLGRLDMTENSDLDLFFIVMNNENAEDLLVCSKLDKYRFFTRLYEINKRLGYKDPSKGGEYWDFISKKDLLDIGSRKEDFNNSFTARMLLILESKPVYNDTAYEALITDIIKEYFRDYDDHRPEFYPLYLMNDILRYWYTLTLNYEYRRDGNDDENEKNWKRLKLKYARLITCFSMLSCLYKKDITPDHVIGCIKKTPFERLSALSCAPSQNEQIESIVQEVRKKY